MPPAKNPVFRKAVIPWYNSKLAYIMVIALMLSICLFSLAGISVARAHPEYNRYIWVPITLLIMGAAIIITTTLRLIKRYTAKSSR